MKLFICCLKGSKPKTYKKIKKEKTISHLWEDFSQASSEESYAKKADKMVLVLLPHSIHTSLHYDPEAASGGGVHSRHSNMGPPLDKENVADMTKGQFPV